MSAKNVGIFLQLRNAFRCLGSCWRKFSGARVCGSLSADNLWVFFEWSKHFLRPFAADLYLCAHSVGSRTQKSKSTPLQTNFLLNGGPVKDPDLLPSIVDPHLCRRENRHTHTHTHMFPPDKVAGTHSRRLFQRNFHRNYSPQNEISTHQFGNVHLSKCVRDIHFK